MQMGPHFSRQTEKVGKRLYYRNRWIFLEVGRVPANMITSVAEEQDELQAQTPINATLP